MFAVSYRPHPIQKFARAVPERGRALQVPPEKYDLDQTDHNRSGIYIYIHIPPEDLDHELTMI